MSSAVLRQAAIAARSASRKCAFSTSAVARKDLIQELYIKELKGYKAPPPPKDAHVGVVKNYSLPPAPQAPALPADLAGELSAWDAAEPTFAAASAKPAEGESTGPTGAEQFLAFLEADEPKHDEAHH
ncbi:ATP synthase complex subunit H-domain-containing protein [Dichomitus squalens]|uniref:ATP synthase complex subunit H-domain-containing protein n=1 Tax=Dichomitus squalens TaxID=114155 RepID=A0A4V2K7D2_9APHY|nr:ATP synthase complex subunit H-domain-containing protein [Dichomitus squalens]TBU55688.1 ATP synthase complex subunit H-domain-containing protein [Dichomitus squalens]